MNDKQKIILSKHQRDLLLEYVSPYILDEEIERAISTVIPKNSKCHIYLAEEDVEELLGSICFVSNHEKKNKNLVLELDDIIDNMEEILDKCK